MSERPTYETIRLQMKETLEAFSKEELMDMLIHIVRTYVIEGATPLNQELSIADFPRQMRDLSFPQLFSQLKIHLDLPELQAFKVLGNEVFVNIDGKDISITSRSMPESLDPTIPNVQAPTSATTTQSPGIQFQLNPMPTSSEGRRTTSASARSTSPPPPTTAPATTPPAPQPRRQSPFDLQMSRRTPANPPRPEALPKAAPKPPPKPLKDESKPANKDPELEDRVRRLEFD